MISERFLFKQNKTPFIDDSALHSPIGELFAGREKCTWTSLELHSKYVAFGGYLTRKQTFTKLITYLHDVVVLNIQGCASVDGLRDFVGKILKLLQWVLLTKNLRTF